MLQTCFFDTKMDFFIQISQRSICTHLHYSDLDSGGQTYLKMTNIFSAYPKARAGGILLDFRTETGKLSSGDRMGGRKIEEK